MKAIELRMPDEVYEKLEDLALHDHQSLDVFALRKLEDLSDYLDLTEVRVRDEGKPRPIQAPVRKCCGWLFSSGLAMLVYGAALTVSLSQTAPVNDQLGTNRFYAASGKWTKASNTNCLVWNSYPRDGESVTWSGDVVDGKAQGTGIVQWFTNGVPTTSYEGEMKHGMADGHGIAKGPSGITEGEFKDGCLASKTMTVHYPNGGWYKGEQKDGFKDGQGEEMMPGGRYIGHFKRERFDGAGELLLPNGDKISGDWKDSKLVGVGTYTRSNGDSFKVQQTDKGIERLQKM